MAPPIEVPWPPMYLVSECTTMSAPWSNTRQPNGVGTVLSTISGRPVACAASAQAPMSMTFSRGLPIVSAKTASCSVVDQGREVLGPVGVGEARLDAVLRQRVREQVVGAAVERSRRDDVVARAAMFRTE